VNQNKKNGKPHEKQIQLRVISVPSIKFHSLLSRGPSPTNVSALRRARKQHCSNLKSELSNLSPSSKSWWHPPSVSGVCAPSIPTLTSNGCSADTAREKAEYLNSVFASKSCVPNPSLTVPTSPSCYWTMCPFLLTRWRACHQTSTEILQKVQAASAHVSSKPALLL